MIGMFAKSGIHFHLVSKHFLFLGRKFVPVFYVFGFGSQLRVLRNKSELLLALECLFPYLIPTLVKFAFVFVNIFFRCMMRGMCSTGGKIHEEGFIRFK